MGSQNWPRPSRNVTAFRFSKLCHRKSVSMNHLLILIYRLSMIYYVFVHALTCRLCLYHLPRTCCLWLHLSPLCVPVFIVVVICFLFVLG